MSRDETSHKPNRSKTAETREEYAEAFNRSADPLAEYSEIFEGLPDPFEYFIHAVVNNRDSITSQDTVEHYRRTYDQYREFMPTDERHPACPSVEHIIAFIEWRRDVHNNCPDYIRTKLNCLNQAYKHWQKESVFPHPESYNPFELAKAEASFGNHSKKNFPDLTLQELKKKFDQLQHVQSRALVGLPLKLGLRAGEVFNLQLQDIRLSHSGLKDCYPQLGTNPALGDYQNVLYVSPDREGNKSSVPRLLPIDEELRWLLIRQLIPRPQVDRPWVFLTERSFDQLSYSALNDPWKEAFHPEYEETENKRSITSHFGRHWFSSYCRLEMGVQREKVQYMRGDLIEPTDEFADAIDDYLHPNYEHIESTYRNEIFKLDLQLSY
jgi:integrase/recombinase XerD